MAFDPLTAVFEAGKIAIEKIWPDENKRAEEMRKLEEMRQNGALVEMKAYTDVLTAQIKVNEVAAAHPSIFVAGARPFVIWVGGASLAWGGLVHPLLMWVWAFAGIEGTPPPMIDSGALFALVSGLLGDRKSVV